MPSLHFVCSESELQPGGRKIIQVGRRSIGVFNVHGTYHALLNVCPHQLAPLCEGRICGYSPPSEVGEYRFEREGEIIRCPWHGWEFDITTGRSIFNPHEVRTASYAVAVKAVDAVDGADGTHGQASPHTGPQDPHPHPAVETFPVRVQGLGIFVEA